MQRRGWRWLSVGTLVVAVVALLAAASATIIIISLAVTFHGEVNVVSAPLSHYAYVEGGNELVSLAAVALAVGVLAVLVGMVKAGVRMEGHPMGLFTMWVICLLLAAVFPTDPSPRVETNEGLMHQLAGAGIFALPPFAVLAATFRHAESPAWRPVVGLVRALSVGAPCWPRCTGWAGWTRSSQD